MVKSCVFQNHDIIVLLQFYHDHFMSNLPFKQTINVTHRLPFNHATSSIADVNKYNIGKKMLELFYSMFFLY